jgi:hypothetical protein
MSAKVTVIVYILICFEVGILLLILPWTHLWEDNFFLYLVTGKLNASWIPTFMTSGYMKGAVTGLGVLNILAGLRDIFKFRESVNTLTTLSNPIALALETEEENTVDTPAPQTAALSDHRPPSVPPQS